ncbi:MAG: helix-turn-helix domain-containing protein [Bacteroidota bacterium]
MAEKILFFFSALGVFNALILSIYLLFFKRKRKTGDYLLGGLLFCLFVRVGVSCFHFFGPVPNAFIKIGLVANLMLGPLLFFLMKTLSYRIKQNRILVAFFWHLGFWFSTLGLLWVLSDFPTWNFKIRYMVHLVLTIYLVFCAVTWRKELLPFFSFGSLSVTAQKARVIYWAVVLICSSFALSLFTSYVLGPILFSLIFYLTITYFLLRNYREKNQSPNKKINPDEFMEMHERLTVLMEQEALFKNPELNLELLAGRLSISKHLLSQLLNENLNKNFYQYVNDYRIIEACRFLKEKGYYSIDAIAYEVGFQSRSSFFAAFKKKMGSTPSKYREKLSPNG